MIIGIDIDDTIAQFQLGFLKYHNEHYGTEMTPEDVYTYGYDKVFGEPMEEMVRRVLEYYADPSFDDITPVPGSQEVLSEWVKEHQLIIITARPDVLVKQTNNWIEKYFPFEFKEVIFTGQFGSNHKGKKLKKSDLCLELGIDVMIEDSPMHAENIANIGIPSVLLDHPWNQNYDNSLVTRVNKWEEINKIIMKLEK